jgi:hypothetical protein
MRIAFTAPVLSLALAAVPALANDHGPDGGPPPPPPAYAPPGHPGPAHAHPVMAPEARANWLAECNSRAGKGKHRKRYAADYCESYLDDYYARYSAPQPYYGYQGAYQSGGYGYPGYAGGCCQQPMMLVPIVRVQQPQRECKEVVEYEYVDVPVRAAPRRPVPDERVKIVPDKRIKTN